eukprot:269424_1
MSQDAFEFNSDENDWGDDDDDDDDYEFDDYNKILQLSRQDSMEKDNMNTCWHCTNCKNVNNVNQTIEKNEMCCCGCREAYYIPDETHTFQCSQPHTHNDYLLRIGRLKQVQVWICKRCTFKNANMQSESCDICEKKRDDSVYITTTLTENTDYKKANNNIHSNQFTNNTINDEERSELLIFGFIRLFINLCNTPKVVCALCHHFYGKGVIVIPDVFAKIITFPLDIGVYTSTKLTHPLKAIFICETDKYINNIFGQQCTNVKNNYNIYR